MITWALPSADASFQRRSLTLGLRGARPNKQPGEDTAGRLSELGRRKAVVGPKPRGEVAVARKAKVEAQTCQVGLTAQQPFRSGGQTKTRAQRVHRLTVHGTKRACEVKWRRARLTRDRAQIKSRCRIGGDQLGGAPRGGTHSRGRCSRTPCAGRLCDLQERKQGLFCLKRISALLLHRMKQRLRRQARTRWRNDDADGVRGRGDVIQHIGCVSQERTIVAVRGWMARAKSLARAKQRNRSGQRDCHVGRPMHPKRTAPDERHAMFAVTNLVRTTEMRRPAGDVGNADEWRPHQLLPMRALAPRFEAQTTYAHSYPGHFTPFAAAIGKNLTVRWRATG